MGNLNAQGTGGQGLGRGRRKVWIPVALVLLTLAIHLPVLLYWIKVEAGWFQGKSFDDYRSINIGDRTYYLAGALSIYEFEITKKFNDKPQPILPVARPITDRDMPSYAKYALAAYPNPVFKFGYSLTAAILTAPFPSRLFEHLTPRLTLANLILELVTLVVIYSIILHFVGSPVAAALGSSFFVFDAWNAFTNYFYQSHTIAGLLFVLLAYLLYIKAPRVSPLRIGCIAFLLSLSVFSSSHAIPPSACLGLLILLSACRRSGPKRIVWLLTASMAGCLVIPAYVLAVETLFRFPWLGLPTLFPQLLGYSAAVGEIVAEFPLRVRFIYDLRIYNVLIVPIALALLFILVRQVIGHRRGRGEPVGQAEDGSRQPKRQQLIVLLVATLVSLAIAMVHGLPVTRGQVPYMVLLGLLVGIWIARRFLSGPRDVRVACLVVVAMLFANFYLLHRVVQLPTPGEPRCAFRLAAIDMTSLSLPQFVERYRQMLSQQKDCFVTFDGMDLVMPYASPRRFSKRFVAKPEDLVTPATYACDFRLLNEIFTLRQKGLLGPDDVREARKFVWDIGLWDQENHYLYGYLNRVRRYTAGTPLAEVDTHRIYYVRFDALERAAARTSPGVVQGPG